MDGLFELWEWVMFRWNASQVCRFEYREAMLEAVACCADANSEAIYVNKFRREAPTLLCR